MTPFISNLDIRDGSQEHALQLSGSKSDWLDLRAAVVTSKHVHWVSCVFLLAPLFSRDLTSQMQLGQAMNWQLESFYAYVGTFVLPSSWLTTLNLSEDKTNGTVLSPSPSNEKGRVFGLDAKTIIYIGAGAGAGIILFLIIVTVWCCLCRNRDN